MQMYRNGIADSSLLSFPSRKRKERNPPLETAKEKGKSGCNPPVHMDYRKSDGKEECKSLLHRWMVGSGKVCNFSVFANIPVKLVACGEQHLIVVSDFYQVFSLGGNDCGQLGLGDKVERKEPSEITSLSEKHINRVSLGSRHSCAITEVGEVFCWGDSRLGQCGNGRRGIFPAPCKLEFLDRSSRPIVVPDSQRSVKVQEIACGEKHTLAVDSQGSLWSWGSGHATGRSQGGGEVLAPKKVTKMRNCRVVQIACGKLHSIALVQEDCDVGQKSRKYISQGLGTSKSIDNMVEGKDGKKITGSRGDKPVSAKNKSTPVETSDVTLIDRSITEFHYSQLDVLKTKKNESIPNADSINECEKEGSVGLCSISKVWAWGDNSYGQLGIGSNDLRIQNSAEPMLITRLDNIDVISVVAGSFHTLALTRECQVYGWGDNSSGQLDMKGDKCLQPAKITALENVRVWDAAAGECFSVFLADSAGDTCHMYQLGERAMKLENEAENPGCQEAPLRRSSTLEKLKKSFRRDRKSSFSDSTSFASYLDTNIKEIDIRRDLILRTVQGSGDQFVCITVSNADELFKEMDSFAKSERCYFYQLGLIQERILKPLQKTESWTAIASLPGGEVLSFLSDCFNELLRLIGVGLSQLTYVIKSGLKVKDLLSFFFSDSVLAGYERYSNCYCDTLAVGHLHSLSKAICGIFQTANDPIADLLQSLSMEEPDLAKFMKIPFTRVLRYADVVRRVKKIVKEPGSAGQLERIFKKLEDLSGPTSSRLRDAENTRKFWNDSSSKLNEALRFPHRRFISKNSNLSLASGSKSLNRTFIMFNDVFVHSQSSNDFQVFELSTVWVNPIADSEEQKYSLRITTPEYSFVLTSDSPSVRTELVKKLNRAIAECLSVIPSNRRIRTSSISSRTGILAEANSREASYTYNVHDDYKSARYSGMWTNGKPHRRGQMEWPDGTVYEGEFEDGRFQGYGTMQFSSSPGEVRLEYEGDWYKGKMNGFGQMKYKNGSRYIGHWKNDERHGHGSFKTFSAVRKLLQTEYVGDWQNDKRKGYGVQHVIVSGEKYIGMWQNDQRDGFGIVVTVDGVYYEGSFSKNKLAGTGTLRSDDDTCYEGEFTADMQLRGKGVLTLPNGDCFDGKFDGRWGDSISVTGKFKKCINPHPRGPQIGDTELNQQKVTESKVPAEVKWTSLFEECKREINGQQSNFEGPGLSVWDNIERVIKQKRSSDIRKRYSRQVKEEESEFVAERGKINCHNFNEIKNCLEKAIETDGHPLHTLVESLAEVYRTTYVGVGTHRRLLLHAVEEAKSYVRKLFDVIRCLLPDLPDEDFGAPSQETTDSTVKHPINSNSLLHPLILPRLYNPLFILYALHYAKADEVYIKRLHQLNKRGDIALMSFLEINRKYMLCEIDEESKELVVGDVPPYQAAILEIRHISDKCSPMGKCDVIQRSIVKIYEEIREFWQGKDITLGADDELPIFSYVVIRAKIPQLGAEIQFIEDLIEPSYKQREIGYRLIELRASYQLIQDEKDKDEESQ